MKRVIAVIRRHRAENLLDKLSEIGMKNAVLMEVSTTGPQTVEEDGGKMNVSLGRKTEKMLRVEFFTPDSHLEECLKIVLEEADTGQPCDGIVSVSPVEKLYRIHKREKIG